jgi:hypothetical protein
MYETAEWLVITAAQRVHSSPGPEQNKHVVDLASSCACAGFSPLSEFRVSKITERGKKRNRYKENSMAFNEWRLLGCYAVWHL